MGSCGHMLKCVCPDCVKCEFVVLTLSGQPTQHIEEDMCIIHVHAYIYLYIFTYIYIYAYRVDVWPGETAFCLYM